MKKQQKGGILIEVLVSLMIFALGVVGLLGSMAVTSKHSSENRFRAEAVSIADELFGQMTVSNPATLSTEYAVGSPLFQAWLINRVQTLPGGNAGIVFDPGAMAGGFLVSLTITWAAPDEPISTYATTTHIR